VSLNQSRARQGLTQPGLNNPTHLFTSCYISPTIPTARPQIACHLHRSLTGGNPPACHPHPPLNCTPYHTTCCQLWLVKHPSLPKRTCSRHVSFRAWWHHGESRLIGQNSTQKYNSADTTQQATAHAHSRNACTCRTQVMATSQQEIAQRFIPAVTGR
jgi:hypothetical protein